MTPLFLVLLTALACLAQPAAPAARNLDSVRVRLGGTDYPRRAMDSQGGVVVVQSAPKRLVSGALNTDEYLYQIVPPETVVGVSRFAYDVAFSAVLGHVEKHQPVIAKDQAAIESVKPDLVIATDSIPLGVVEGLKAAGIPVFRLWTNVTRLEQVADNITVVGYLTGQDESARRERERLEREIAGIEAQCRTSKVFPAPARVYGVSMEGFTFGENTLFQDVIRRIGAVNVAAENGVPAYDPVTSDDIARFNPGWVFTWSAPGAENHEKELRRWINDAKLGVTPAAKANRIIVSDGKDIFLLSPRVTTMAHILADHVCGKAR
jgi:iron complex transport system substrate-binding protein